MSDEAQDLLLYGVAAAKANSREEARNYLEWVLRTDADLEQQAEAWYWLSTITDDAAERRSCLESSLAAMPGFPESRRDLAILDGRLAPGQMHDPRREVAPIVPSPNLTPDDLLRYKCPRCGARLTVNAHTGDLACSFCGYRHDNAQTGDRAYKDGEAHSGHIKEQDWDAAIYSDAGHRWEVPTARTFECRSCGASVLVPPGQVSTVCPFCGTAHVVQSQAERELIEPTGILPFTLLAQDAFAAIVGWLRSAHFAPEDLSLRATQTMPHTVYLPVWTFDLAGEVRWSGHIPKVEYRTVTSIPTHGSVPMLENDVLVPATGSLPGDVIEQLHFDLRHLVPYSADLLASWPAEIYSISAAEASIEARGRVLQETYAKNLIEANGDTSLVEGLSVDSTDLWVLSYKLVLLPVWIGSYTYLTQLYHVVVNGYSGMVAGNVPRNLWQKVLNHLLG
jgi:uncharacterized Zn finger protein (UPF0148 family)